MTVNTAPVFELTPVGKGVQFTSADTTTKKTIVAGTDIPPEGLRIDSLPVTSNDTATVTLMWYINDGSTDFHIGDTVIAIGAGYGAVARPDAMSTLAPNLGYIALPDGYALKAACLATMTAAKTLDIMALGGTFG